MKQGGALTVKKFSRFAFCFASLLLFTTGCQSDDNQPDKGSNSHFTQEASTQEIPISKDGFSLEIEKAQYPASTENITLTFQNDSNKEYETGIHVFLEKNVNDMWYKVPLKDDTVTLPSALHRPGTSSKFTFETKDLKYKLTPGEYRATFGGLAAPFKVIE